VIVIDANILVYARREGCPEYPQAHALLQGLSQGDRPWAIPWPCVYQFLRVVTHPTVFEDPTPLERAIEDLERLMESPTLTMLGNGPAHAGHLRRCVLEGSAKGNMVHDAHIAALAIEHGVTEFLSHDHDFARFPGLRWRDPFLPPRA